MAAFSEGGQIFAQKLDGLDVSDSDFRLKDLMSKLRHRSNQLKSWEDTAKALRIAMSDKRHQSGALERGQLQKSLDTLQKAIKVTTVPCMLERLENISRQLFLRYHLSGSSVFISSDMFYVEVQLEGTGRVRDVKLTHEQWDPVSCQDIARVLSTGDFSEFTEHLKGLIAIYQIPGDKKQKTKAYMSLQFLENDLNTVAQLQSSISGVSNYIHKVIGILQPRQGGRPMKLTYFVAPYDLLNAKTKTSYPLTIETITEKNLGHSVTVVMEKSAPHKLQTMPLISITKHEGGSSLPSFAPLTHINRVTLPAVFVLKLQKPIPICQPYLTEILNITGDSLPEDIECTKALIQLIAEDVSEGKVDCDKIAKGLFVTLPGQQQCYYMNSAGSVTEMKGAIIREIPFVHPTAILKLLSLLRQQLLFNTVIGSCVRPEAKEDLDNSLVFEVTASSLQQLSVTFEHPLDESMATADFNLSDVTNVKCRIFSASPENLCSDDLATKILQRSLSIPITMRAIICQAVSDLKKQPPPIADVPAKVTPNYKFSEPFMDSPFYCGRQYSAANLDTSQGFSHGITTASLYASTSTCLDGIGGATSNIVGTPQMMTNAEILTAPQRVSFPSTAVPPVLNELVTPPMYRQGDYQQQLQNVYQPNSTETDNVQKNPMLASLLDQENPEPAGASSILSSLLCDDMPSSEQQMPAPKSRKPRRRRTGSDQGTGKSPKRKRSDADDMTTPEYGGNVFDFVPSATLPGTLMSPSGSDSMYSPGSGNLGLQEATRFSPINTVLDHEQKTTTEIAAILNENSMGTSSSVNKSLPSAGPNIKRKSPSTGANFKNSRPNSRCEEITEISSLLREDISPLNPDMFPSKTSGTFTPTDFLGSSSGSVNPDSGPNAMEVIDFNTDLLNSNLTETMSEPSDNSNLDLDTCDANAFGTGFSPAVVASKTENPALGSNRKNSGTPPGGESGNTGNVKSDNVQKTYKCTVQREMTKKLSKDGKVKERKKSKSAQDKGDKSILKTPTVAVRFLEKSVDSPQEALDLTKKEKPLKVTIRTYPELPKDQSGQAEAGKEPGRVEAINDKPVGSKPSLPKSISLDTGRKLSESEEPFRKRKREDAKKERGGKKKRDEGRTLVDPTKVKTSGSGEKLHTRIKITTSGGKIKISSTPRSASDSKAVSSKPPTVSAMKFSPTPSKLASLPRIPKLSQRQPSTGDSTPNTPSASSQVSSSPLAPKVPSSPLKVTQSSVRMSSPINKSPGASKVVSPVRMQSLIRPGATPPKTSDRPPLLATPGSILKPSSAGKVERPALLATPVVGRRSSTPVGSLDNKDMKQITKPASTKLKPILITPGYEKSDQSRGPVSTPSDNTSKPAPVIPTTPTVTSPTGLHKARPRKGSLTAVIDKLTKAQPVGASNAGCEDAATLTATTPDESDSNRNIFEKFASSDTPQIKASCDENVDDKIPTETISTSSKEMAQSVFKSTESKPATALIETPDSPPVEESTTTDKPREVPVEIPVDPITRIDSAPQSPDPEPIHNMPDTKTIEIPMVAMETNEVSKKSMKSPVTPSGSFVSEQPMTPSDYSQSQKVAICGGMECSHQSPMDDKYNDDVLFKAPTPKTPQSVGNKSPKTGDMPGDDPLDDNETLMRSRSNSVASSRPSSPEDGLVIDDCPKTPVDKLADHPPEGATGVPDLPVESAWSPAVNIKSPRIMEETPSPAPHVSKTLSPSVVANVRSPSAPLSVKSTTSSCPIDDDLMDEVLMGGFGS